MQKFCQNCGESLREDAAFCSSCGKQISSIKSLEPKRHYVKFFIGSVCSMVLSIICMFVTKYLHETELTGNAKAVVRSMGNSRELARIELHDTWQIITAYSFIVLLAVAIILLIVGVVLHTKEKVIRH